MSQDIFYRVHDGDPDEVMRLSEDFCSQLFPSLAPNFVRSRLPYVAEPQLCLAERAARPVGFKLSYRLSSTILFSWLGGVLPEARRQGIAAGLMQFQHREAVAAGYSHVETRTRTSNNAMIMLNLAHGFEIVGLETDAFGRFVVIQRKPLS
ncbi:GNAT family N-acetyltransferase [Rhizosaccharibacter radicis]|uniref:GNAT family N-acetyltransferase n=1 Tax=Rhizosaccharibacter radicis TaxID=2782605 RepID=A0ABT1VX30_9PROT|nr:GNAT family N-acetyltransferase [Acetobacteraceae bacterium KSS12]